MSIILHPKLQFCVAVKIDYQLSPRSFFPKLKWLCTALFIAEQSWKKN